MLLYLLYGSYEQIHWSLSPKRFFSSKLLWMFVFSLEGPLHPARAAVTEKAFTRPAIQVMPVQSVLDKVWLFHLFSLVDQ